MSERCCAKIYDARSYRGYPCSKKATTKVDGHWYCGTHDPVRVKARKDKRVAEYKAKSAALYENWAYEEAKRAFDAACVEAIREIAAGYDRENYPLELAREVMKSEPTKP